MGASVPEEGRPHQVLQNRQHSFLVHPLYGCILTTCMSTCGPVIPRLEVRQAAATKSSIMTGHEGLASTIERDEVESSLISSQERSCSMCRSETYYNHAQCLTTGMVQLQHQELPPPAVRSGHQTPPTECSWTLEPI